MKRDVRFLNEILDDFVRFGWFCVVSGSFWASQKKKCCNQKILHVPIGGVKNRKRFWLPPPHPPEIATLQISSCEWRHILESRIAALLP